MDALSSFDAGSPSVGYLRSPRTSWQISLASATRMQLSATQWQYIRNQHTRKQPTPNAMKPTPKPGSPKPNTPATHRHPRFQVHLPSRTPKSRLVPDRFQFGADFWRSLRISKLEANTLRIKTFFFG